MHPTSRIPATDLQLSCIQPQVFLQSTSRFLMTGLPLNAPKPLLIYFMGLFYGINNSVSTTAPPPPHYVYPPAGIWLTKPNQTCLSWMTSLMHSDHSWFLLRSYYSPRIGVGGGGGR
jgi:hypothetical protein